MAYVPTLNTCLEPNPWLARLALHCFTAHQALIPRAKLAGIASQLLGFLIRMQLLELG